MVSLLAGRLERDGFGVTLADLAARGWFRLSGTRVNLHNREVSIDPVEPPAVARPLADVAAGQERAVAGSRLPDPACW